KRRLCERNRNHAMQVIPLPLEEGMLLHVKHEIEIPHRAAVCPSLAQASETNAGLIFNPGGNLPFDRFLLYHSSLPLALRALIADYRARSVTVRAGTGNTEKALLIADLPSPATRPAGGRSFVPRAS